MAEFTYNNVKNTSNGYIFFKLNYSYQLQMLCKKKVNPHSMFNLADELWAELKELMIIC